MRPYITRDVQLSSTPKLDGASDAASVFTWSLLKLDAALAELGCQNANYITRVRYAKLPNRKPGEDETRVATVGQTQPKDEAQIVTRYKKGVPASLVPPPNSCRDGRPAAYIPSYHIAQMSIQICWAPLSF